MHWQDEGIVLTAKPHGESSAVIAVLTREHGQARGLVRGGNSKAKRPLLQPGNKLNVEWRGRLEDQLGQFTAELQKAYAAICLANPYSLSALQTLCSLLAATLPEHHPYPKLFRETENLLDTLQHKDWLASYIRYELTLLAELGFALDLSRCAVTGAADDLRYVSPRTGRAVCSAAAKGYENRLLPLPRFLTIPFSLDGFKCEAFIGGAQAPDEGAINQATQLKGNLPHPSFGHPERLHAFSPQGRGKNNATSNDIQDGFALTGYFLERTIFHTSNHPALLVRERLLGSTRQRAA